MRSFEITLPELAFVAATRGMAGLGIGFLLSDYLKPDTRRAVGWTLFAIGGLSTVPIAASLFYHRQQRLLAD